MKWLKKLALRYALNREQRVWIWNAMAYSRKRYEDRKTVTEASRMREIMQSVNSGWFFSKKDPLFRRITTHGMIDPTFISKGEKT